MIYLKKNVRGHYVEFAKPLNEAVFKIGSTYEDFLFQKWIPLSEEQVQFHLDNPRASVKEVIDMKLTPISEPTIEELIQTARQNKLQELDRYDGSSEVNEFTINGQLKAWFTPNERANYKNSIDSASLLGIENLQLLVDKSLIELPTKKAAQLLATIQLYADACYMVTEQHKAAINALENLTEIEDYDFTVGYPKKLDFEL